MLKRKVRRQAQFGTESSRRRELSLGTPLFTFPLHQNNQQGNQQGNHTQATNQNNNPSNNSSNNQVIGSDKSGAAVTLAGGKGGSGGSVKKPAPVPENRSTENSGVRRRRQGVKKYALLRYLERERGVHLVSF